MTEQEAKDMAMNLLDTYKDTAFEVSMPDEQSYDLMRATFLSLGRKSGPDGEFLVIKVPAFN